MANHLSNLSSHPMNRRQVLRLGAAGFAVAAASRGVWPLEHLTTANAYEVSKTASGSEFRLNPTGVLQADLVVPATSSTPQSDSINISVGAAVLSGESVTLPHRTLLLVDSGPANAVAKDGMWILNPVPRQFEKDITIPLTWRLDHGLLCASEHVIAWATLGWHKDAQYCEVQTLEVSIS